MYNVVHYMVHSCVGARRYRHGEGGGEECAGLCGGQGEE
jgi:hypothetical protein